jgi:hypothetical protein
MAFNISTRVKEYLKLTANTHDTFLANLIIDTTSAIEAYCNQPIEQVGVILKKLEIMNNDTIILPYTSPVAIISVEYSVPFSGVYTTLATTEYEFFYDGYVPMIWFRTVIDTSYTWKITAAVGYVAADIPDDIISVAIEMVAFKFKESVVGENILGKGSVGTSQSGASSTTSYLDMWSKWKERLNRYRVYPS